jgi:hypothetical protein
MADPCDIRFTPNSVACMAKGGKADTNPCNILNPLHNINVCNASEISKQASSTKYGWILWVVLGVLGLPILLLLIFYLTMRSPQYGGSKRSFLSKLFKHF